MVAAASAAADGSGSPTGPLPLPGSPPRRVAILGAGPSGLAAAKAMVQAGLVPTVFDAATAIGGLWRVDEPGDAAPASALASAPASASACGPASGPASASASGSHCWASMTTNLSHYTVAFSDFPWPPGAPDFPSPREVGEYLRAYAAAFLRPEHVRLGATVIAIEPAGKAAGKRSDPAAPGAGGGWRVHWRDGARDGSAGANGSPPDGAVGGAEAAPSSCCFDHVVVATGFFSEPLLPQLPGAASFPGRLLHSCEYREPSAFAGQRVAVAGASFSAVEIASEVASRAASVTHVCPRRVRVLPRYVPADPADPATFFLPLDLAFYSRAARASREEMLFRSPSEYRQAAAYLDSLLGDESGLAAAAPRAAASAAGGSAGGSSAGGGPAEPPFVAVSDTYAARVRAGRIAVAPGRVAELAPDGSLTLSDGSPAPGGPFDALIMATGYRPRLPFLPQEVLRALDFQPDEAFSPLLLHGLTWHPSSGSDLAYVGMYRGPYFAVLELQARWAALVFSGQLPPPSAAAMAAGLAREAAVRAQSPRPQFPHGDYVGLADALAAEIHALPSEGFRESNPILLPAHFSADRAIAAAAVARLDAAMARYAAGRMVPWAIFRALPGEWILRRSIVSRHASSPSGTVVGTARFSPAGDASSSGDLWYSESGEFRMEGNPRPFQVKREYIYAYDRSAEALNVFFVAADPPAPPPGAEQPAPGRAVSEQAAAAPESTPPGKVRGLPFLELRFLPPEGPASEGADETARSGVAAAGGIPRLPGPGWHAAGTHPCGCDLYRAAYRFAFRGASLAEMEVAFHVAGPEKDYVATALYTRPEA